MSEYVKPCVHEHNPDHMDVLFFFEYTKLTLFYLVTFIPINGNLIKLWKKTKIS